MLFKGFPVDMDQQDSKIKSYSCHIWPRIITGAWEFYLLKYITSGRNMQRLMIS